jgi:hypothetical protein
MSMQTNVGTGRTDGSRAEVTEPAHAPRRLSTETKSSIKTTELLAYIAAVAGVIVMSYLVKTTNAHSDYFRADKAMFYIVILTVGYLVSRGIAKAGSRDYYTDRD